MSHVMNELRFTVINDPITRAVDGAALQRPFSLKDLLQAVAGARCKRPPTASVKRANFYVTVGACVTLTLPFSDTART